MLKIKDNVDLKTLERYGFKLNKEKTEYEQEIDNNWWDIRGVWVDDRWLYHMAEEIGYWASTDDDDLLSCYFEDLIKDGLVEKVGSDKE